MEELSLRLHTQNNGMECLEITKWKGEFLNGMKEKNSCHC
jgi:hypothetical protein